MGLLDTWLDDPKKQEFFDYFREYPGRVKEEFMESAAGIKPEFGAMGTQPPSLGMAYSWLTPWLMDISEDVGEKAVIPLNAQQRAMVDFQNQMAGQYGMSQREYSPLTGEQAAPFVAMAAMWPFGGRGSKTPFNPQAFRTAATNVRSHTVKALEELSENIGNIFNLPQLATPTGPVSGLSMMSGGGRPYGGGVGRRGRPTKAEGERQLQDLAEAKRLKELQVRQQGVMAPAGGELVTPETSLATQNPLTNMVNEFEAKVVALEDYFDSIKQKSFEPDKTWKDQEGLSETIPKGVIDPHAQAPRPVYDYRMQSEQALADWSARRSGLPAEDIGPFKWRQKYAHPDFQFDEKASELAVRGNDALWDRFETVKELTKGGQDILAELKTTNRVLAETGNLTWMGKPVEGPVLETIIEGIHEEIGANMDAMFAKDAAIKKGLQAESLERSRGKELGDEYSPEKLRANYAKALEVLEGTKPLTAKYLETATERGLSQTKRRKAEVSLDKAREALTAFETGGEGGLRKYLGYPYVDTPGVEQVSAQEGSYFKLDDVSQKGLYSIGFEPENFDAEGSLNASGKKRLIEWRRESSAPEGQALAKIRKPTGIETGHLGKEEYYDRGTIENWRMMKSMTPPEVRSYLLEQAKFRTDKLYRQLGDPFRNYMKGMKEWGFTAPEYQDPLTKQKQTLFSDKWNAYQEMQEVYNHVTDLLYAKQQPIDMSTPEGRYESAKLATQALESINSSAEYISLLEREPAPHKKGSTSGLWVDEKGRSKRLMLKEGEGGHRVIEPMENAFAPPRERNVYLTDQHMYSDSVELPDHDAVKLFEYSRQEVGAPSGFAGGQGRKIQDWRKAMVKEAESLLLQNSNFKEIAKEYKEFLEDQESPPLDIYEINSRVKKLEDLVRAKFNMTAQFEFIQADKWGRDDFVVPDFPKWLERTRHSTWGIRAK